jgi:hypothetical protein
MQGRLPSELPAKERSMNTGTYTRTVPARSPSASSAGAHRAERPARSHLADYIIDVFFVALLAAPFLIFYSPESVQDAVGGHAAVSASAPSAQGPGAPAASEYGPE